MKNSVSWYVTLCGSCKNRCVGGTYCLHHQGDKNWRARNNVSSNLQLKHAEKIYYVLRLQVTVNVVLRSPVLVTLMMEAIHAPEKSVLTRATRCNNQEDALIRSHRRDNLKFSDIPFADPLI
jgi:hypothetical protein